MLKLTISSYCPLFVCIQCDAHGVIMDFSTPDDLVSVFVKCNVLLMCEKQTIWSQTIVQNSGDR